MVLNIAMPDQDNNCNGETDENIAEECPILSIWTMMETVLENSLIYQYSCFPVEGHVLQDGDCDDERFESNPNADEYCNDIDDNCDTIIDEITSVDAINWYLDADEDGFGDPNALVIDCYQPNTSRTIQTVMITDLKAIQMPPSTVMAKMIIVLAVLMNPHLWMRYSGMGIPMRMVLEMPNHQS